MQLKTNPSASLWDGKQQLEGLLELRHNSLRFTLKDFPDSHMQLTIPFDEIESMEKVLVWAYNSYGWLITGKLGKKDLFLDVENQNELVDLKSKLLESFA
ncbi:MAG: hypothetical protein DWQ02_09220 [Bacteroidetes bacterium]|nr:MAG: hypothetical protein DWQ02_09220 [Bacteroidota bacterium]